MVHLLLDKGLKPCLLQTLIDSIHIISGLAFLRVVRNPPQNEQSILVIADIDKASSSETVLLFLSQRTANHILGYKTALYPLPIGC